MKKIITLKKIGNKTLLGLKTLHTKSSMYKRKHENRKCSTRKYIKNQEKELRREKAVVLVCISCRATLAQVYFLLEGETERSSN